MTVCIATSDYLPTVGGISTFNLELSLILAAAGHKAIVLFATDEDGPDEIQDELNGNLIVNLKTSYRKHLSAYSPYFSSGGFDAPRWIALGMAMKEWLTGNHNQFGIDVIEASDYGGLGIFLSDPGLPPLILTGHGSLLQYSRYNFARNDDHFKVICKLEELSFRNADAIIAHSPLDKNDLENLFDRMIEFAHIPWRYNELGDPYKPNIQKILVVGGLQPIKGVYVMAEAMQLVSVKYPELMLYWIGPDTWFAPGQKKMSGYLAEKYPEGWRQFIWQGEKDLPSTILEMIHADIVVIPSVFESFNYVALEATALGRPIIISEGAGASFLFKDQESAIIVPSNKAIPLAEALIKLVNNKSLQEKLIDGARESIQGIFQGNKVVEERMAIYKKVIANRRPRESKDNLDFLDSYKSTRRKVYYSIRSIAKKILKPTK
jgi:glycosyltransferase involved in cell wall biosynthesis